MNTTESWYTQKRVFLWPEPISVIYVYPIFLGSFKLMYVKSCDNYVKIRLFEVPGLLCLLLSFRQERNGPVLGQVRTILDLVVESSEGIT